MLNANGLPAVVVGIPLMTPVAAFTARPGGNDPVDIVQLL
jgi:hypothetical protein